MLQKVPAKKKNKVAAKYPKARKEVRHRAEEMNRNEGNHFTHPHTSGSFFNLEMDVGAEVSDRRSLMTGRNFSDPVLSLAALL